MFWGNTNCYWAKLKDNMTELDVEIRTIELPRFVEVPWGHKRNICRINPTLEGVASADEPRPVRNDLCVR
jgi:hypothetical protein